MRKQVETIRKNATLTLDGERTFRVSVDITVRQNYLTVKGYVTTHEPTDYDIRGKVRLLDLREILIPCGEKTNVLDLGNDRKIDIHAPEIYQRGQSFTFDSYHDQMTFFDTPLYRRLEEEQG
jgi:hypothetical protein